MATQVFNEAIRGIAALQLPCWLNFLELVTLYADGASCFITSVGYITVDVSFLCQSFSIIALWKCHLVDHFRVKLQSAIYICYPRETSGDFWTFALPTRSG